MEKKYKLKIICLLCAFAAAFSSCKKNELAEEDGLTGNHENLAIAADGKWDLLGHGYDVTGELFARESASDVSIIDIDRFNSDYPGRIVTPTDSKGDYEVYYGANAYDYVNEINKKKTFGITSTGGSSQPEPKDNKLYATANFSKTNEDNHTYTYSSKNSYATYESWFRIKTIDFTGDATVDLLKNYLTPLFIANLSNYSPEQLVERYGTHVLLGIDIGGRLKYDYKGAIIKESNYDRKVRAVKAGFSIGIAKLFSVDLSTDVSKEEKTTISNETTDKLFRGVFYGGDNSGASFSGDALGNTSTNINLISWQQSININNASLININKSVPIYDFITDPVKKHQVKDAVDKYISDRQIEIAKEEVYAYYSRVDQRHAYTLDAQMQRKYPSFSLKEISFKAYSGPHNGAIPIYQFYNSGGNDRVLTTKLNPGWAWYNYDGILFYAYDTQIAGTVPIYEFVHSLGDRYYSTLRNPNGMDANWKFNGQQFYAFPK